MQYPKKNYDSVYILRLNAGTEVDDLDYITAKEAAEKWGVKVRRIQDLCSKNLIPGVRNWGNGWMIPSEVQKPKDRRKHREIPKNKTHPFLPYIFSTDYLHLTSGKADLALNQISDPDQKELAAAEFDYLRGNFDSPIQLYKKTQRYDKTRISILSVAQGAAVSIGKYSLYCEIQEEISSLQSEFKHDPQLSTLLNTAKFIGEISMYLPSQKVNIHDFQILPIQSRSFALYMYAKSLLIDEKHEQLCGVVEAALCYKQSQGYIPSEIYLRVMYAIALEWLGKRDLAKQQLIQAMEFALPDGFITPFAEHLTKLGWFG
ncbi:MAG: hypothetical protein VB108_05795 [Anaerolineaceae bacterium]|nr:hypothetical protein [Anaerolineaceae bacterium]